MYAKYLKRVLDFIISLCALLVLSPLLLILTILGWIFMGGNPFFVQPRPGKDEKIFNLVKFRSMSNKKDKDGNLLPDDVRLNKYGRFLRSTSLDELPELYNILVGDMSIVGPRPLLVKDMVFMSEKQRKRHSVRQGLTGLAQVNGRNNISWEQKLAYDLEYVQNITIKKDVEIVINTILCVLKRKDINREGTSSDIDLGDYLLANNSINEKQYQIKITEAEKLIEDFKYGK